MNNIKYWVIGVIFLNLEWLKSLDPSIREKIMREEIGEEKRKIVDKYGLHPNDRIYWERRQEKYPTQEYFSHKLLVKASPLGVVFHINRLCFAKTKYFENNWSKFEACVYDYKKGFVNTEICNMEFIRQKSTGIVLDLRALAKIKWLSEFQDLCRYMEEKERGLFEEDCSREEKVKKIV